MSFTRESFIKEAKAQKRSEAFIQKTLAYADGLIEKNLPVIFSRKHLSILLGFPVDKLTAIITNRENNYTYYPIKKRTGGTRMISAPYSGLNQIQKWINLKILSQVSVSESAKGFKKGCSIRDNASPHSSKVVIMNIDLLKFFDSIPEFKVYQVFLNLGYAKNVARDLAVICTVPLHDNYLDTFSPAERKIFSKTYDNGRGVLPQGAPSSPALSNIILKELDQKLKLLAADHSCSYSRYADDITLSSEQYQQLPSKNLLISVVKSEGLFINFKKFKIYKQGQKQRVTGLTIAHGVHVPKAYRKDIFRHIYFCQKYGPDDHLKRIGMGDKKFFRDWLLGRIHFVHSIDKVAAEEMYKQFNSINWPI